MRLPKESQLSSEQREVCYAPTEGTTLIVGPPGSGKTVVGYYQKEMLERQGDGPQFLVYNHVLSRYTGSGETFFRWLWNWWKNAAGRSMPKGAQKWEYDYGAAMHLARGDLRDRVRERGGWEHLILDEAQDFPKEAHELLFTVQSVVFKDLPEDERPSMLILADENQRLQEEKNSTIEDIEEAHLLDRDAMYSLTRNYRNTREIALFAREFYVGLPSGRPEVPQARGEKPSVVMTGGLPDAVERIRSYAIAHDDQEVGVLVWTDHLRKKLVSRLRARLAGTGLQVQSYSGRRGDSDNDAEKLKFDSPGTVTVLCFASAKGLEFDAVFLPELQSFKVTAENREWAKMNLYVMTSRARKRLFLMMSDAESGSEIWGILPRDSDLFDLEA